MTKVLVINGPNLNFLGKRRQDIYGELSLDQIIEYTQKKLSGYSVEVEWFQSNIEGELVNRIQKASTQSYDLLVINPAAYSHTSIAILDALELIPCKIIEVHLSNTFQREEFRQKKITARASSMVIVGAGKAAYYLAIYSQLLNLSEDN